jgi:hypothetical protein
MARAAEEPTRFRACASNHAIRAMEQFESPVLP